MYNKIYGHRKFDGGLEDSKDILGIRVASIDVHSQNHKRSHLKIITLIISIKILIIQYNSLVLYVENSKIGIYPDSSV